MFGFGKQKTNGVVNIDKKRSINLDQVPVISMRQDLENILKGTPEIAPVASNEAPATAPIATQPIPQPISSAPQPPQNNTVNLSEKYKSSPFLGPDVQLDQTTNTAPDQSNAPNEKEKQAMSQAVPVQVASFQASKASMPPDIQSSSIPVQIKTTPVQTNQNQTTFSAPANINPFFQSSPRQQGQPMVKPSFKINSPSQASASTSSPNLTNQAVASSTEPIENLKKEPAWGKLLFSAILIFVILIFSAGGYYFWLTKKSEGQVSSQPENTQASQIATQNTSFSTDQPNFFAIDIDNMDKYQIKAALKKNADDVVNSNIQEAIEFNIINPKNESVKFEIFSDKVEMKLPASVLYNLNSDFKIFAYNDNQTPFLGLAIASKDSAKLSEVLVGEELNLASSLEFFYFTSGYDPESKTFAPDSYGGAEIRSLEINSNEKLSLNYSLYKNYLLIGTSKMTLRSMIDHLNKDTQVQGAEDVVN
jgi:hypothetical protein